MSMAYPSHPRELWPPRGCERQGNKCGREGSTQGTFTLNHTVSQAKRFLREEISNLACNLLNLSSWRGGWLRVGKPRGVSQEGTSKYVIGSEYSLLSNFRAEPLH
jgi:hypothetical protein